MPLKIAQLGQPVLRHVADPVPPGEIATAEFQKLIDDMFETLRQVRRRRPRRPAGLHPPPRLPGRDAAAARSEDEPARGEVFVNPD